jgi:hypothetical protein
VSQDRWDKMKGIVKRIQGELTSTGRIDHKELERNRGRLVYGTKGYPAMKPYLKGIHLTLNSWRKGRDAEGWKKRRQEIEDDDDGIFGFERLAEEFDRYRP